jgi:hypothetical protein
MKSVVLSSSPSGVNRVAASLKPQTNQQVRNRFFNMIGIESQLPSTATVPDAATINQGWVNPRSQMVVCSAQSLKYDRDADKALSSKRRKTCDKQQIVSPGKRKKSLNFNETVNVVPIPMRDEYSNRVRTRLWSNAIEIHENATRNTIEFAAEG